MLKGLAAASSNSTLQSGANDNQDFDVVIIGAGWSGLGAAKTLLSKGFTNFLVLEASDTIGGRCQTVTLNDGISAELGCQWVHGASTQNPVYNIVKKSGITTKKCNFDDIALYSNVYGGIGPHRVWNVPETEYNRFMSFQEKLQDSTNYDQPLRKIADRYIKKRGLKGNARLRFEYLLDTYIVQEYAASLQVQDLSLWWQV
jgi:monoamine oxidase